MNRERVRTTIRGAVQGVGFRPFVFRLAQDLQLNGWISNSGGGVLIEAEGEAAALRQFLQRLEKERPVHAVIQGSESSFLDPVGYDGFEIRQSEKGSDKTALILPDIATCSDCLREIFDPANRRFRYPFTNCTNCGPRFSIIEALPYDRAQTSMQAFTMCRECEGEYRDPRDRRFHAQPNACPRCGPQLSLWDGEGRAIAEADEALLGAANAVRSGQIVALKGLGGFQLIVDATSDAAVERLRQRKHREEKPFAVMFPSLEAADNACQISALEERLLLSPEAPIVLLLSKRENLLAASVAPRNPNLGVMLPYSPLHHLFLRACGGPVVATSGNLSDEPICIDESEAIARLANVADLFLVHDRPIIRHMDDSIVRMMAGRELVLRRARGYAPLPVHLPRATRPILALGAHLKNTVALAVGENVFISQHLGDLSTRQAYEAFVESASDLPRLYEVTPEIIACDQHPDYLSSKHAELLTSNGKAQAASHRATGEPPVALVNLAAVEVCDESPPAARESGAGSEQVTSRRIQHHFAHIASCMAENELDPPLLGVSWDGTGYGGDGTIWGGEFLQIADGGFSRFAHLRQFRLPGGEAAVKEPRRCALGLLHEIYGDELWEKHDLLAGFSENELNLLTQVFAKRINAPLTSSAGRLFDAVAGIVGLRARASFEGQAAMELEFAVDRSAHTHYSFHLVGESPIVVDWQPAIIELMNDRAAGRGLDLISAKFHHMLVEAIVAIAHRARQPSVVLSGGCFQNRYLTERTIERLSAEGFRPYWHQRIPPNDGGISLGQVFAAEMKGWLR